MAQSEIDGQKGAVSVTQALNAARRSLEQIHLTVIGEVSEFNDKPGYKAAYFTISDEDSAMQCLMWRDKYRASDIELRQGMLVEVSGMFSCYVAKGRMQFSVQRIQLAGEGDLRMKVARIAKKLQAEGLMEESRKRKPPRLPQRIAVVTSPRGKAVHDVLRTLRRRYPMAEVALFGAMVEGAAAPEQIRKGLAAAQDLQPAADVILLVRGGGSYEDLMPFNDEGLARAVAASNIPVVTGIGHEPDNSIADMVADLRCSTPTAAAEAVAPSKEELQQTLAGLSGSLAAALQGRVEAASHRFERQRSRPVWNDPDYLLGSFFQSLDLVGERLARALPDALRQDAHRLELMQERLRVLSPNLLRPYERSVDLADARLKALSPLKTLDRGYSIAYGADGSVIDTVDKVAKGQQVKVRVKDGSMNCDVDSIERKS